MLDLGFTRQLQLADFYKLPPEQESATLTSSLEDAWEHEAARAEARGREVGAGEGGTLSEVVVLIRSATLPWYCTAL